MEIRSMKKRLALSILSLGVAMALLATNLGQHKPLSSSVVEAGANFVTVAAQQCLGPNEVRVGFTWTGYNEGPQWVDLSLSDNGFFPGTFVGLGPLASSQTSFTWDGILAGLTHFLRVNTLTAAGWSTSPTIAFTTRNDCQFVAQVAPGVGASNLALSQMCLLNGSPRVALTWTSSNQGQQWLDNSAYSAYFEQYSFTSVGPFVSNQTAYNWDGLVPGSVHFVRINTGTPSGWIGSPTSTFFVRSDCPAPVPATAVPVAPIAAPTAVPMAAP
jgi:hypothetical protein